MPLSEFEEAGLRDIADILRSKEPNTPSDLDKSVGGAASTGEVSVVAGYGQRTIEDPLSSGNDKAEGSDHQEE